MPPAMPANATRTCRPPAFPAIACRMPTPPGMAPSAKPATPQPSGRRLHFNHDRMTKFPLRGEHAKVKCDTCHSGDLYRDKLATTCVSCHKKDDAHKAQLGTRCEQCHRETGLAPQSRLRSRRHAIPVDRASCHCAMRGMPPHDLVQGGTARLRELPQGQPSRRPPHEQLRACATIQTDGYAGASITTRRLDSLLDGAHRGLNCHACHTVKAATKISISSACAGCHNQDDVHQGSFGKSCERCHNTTSFKRGIIRR